MDQFIVLSIRFYLEKNKKFFQCFLLETLKGFLLNTLALGYDPREGLLGPLKKNEYVWKYSKTAVCELPNDVYFIKACETERKLFNNK